MDMWKPFRLGTAAHAPQAAILFDKFHVMRHLGEALDHVRKSEYGRLAGRDRRYIKGQKYTLLSRKENLTLDGKKALNCSRIIATIQRASSTELPAESGEKRRRAVPVKVRPFCASKQQKRRPFSLTSKPASENREGRRMTYAITWAEWVGHADASMRPHAG